MHAHIQQLQSVIDWNGLPRNGEHPIADPDAIAFQWSLVREEAQETLDAIRDKNAREVLDGVCDLFVVAGYYAHIGTGQSAQALILGLPDLPILGRSEFPLSTIMYRLIERMSETPLETLRDVFVLVRLLEKIQIPMADMVTHTMDSNWSKFPLLGRLQGRPQDEALRIEEHFSVSTQVVPIVTPCGRVVFRDHGGAGKIRKPSTFWSPRYPDVYVSRIDREFVYA